jgi:hypothetical protein
MTNATLYHIGVALALFSLALVAASTIMAL